ncbi:RAB34 protein, partial [Chloropsis hardwickii]|nr:RAB34 protein [Chloropsis hardwickii]
MNVLAPVRRDRIIADLPACFRKEAALHTRPAFHPAVASACQEQRTGTVGSARPALGSPRVARRGVGVTRGPRCRQPRVGGPRRGRRVTHGPGVAPGMSVGPLRAGQGGVLGLLWCLSTRAVPGQQLVTSGSHRQWLADALKENDPSNVILFLVGSKKDLSVSVSPSLWADRGHLSLSPTAARLGVQTPAQYSLMEKDALKVAQEMQAEYWAVSSLTGESQLPGGTEIPASARSGDTQGVSSHGAGENVRDFFFRVAALTFESSVLAELERGSGARRIGDTVRISSKESDLYLSTPRKKPKCCQ